MKNYRILRFLAEVVEKIYGIELSPESEKKLEGVEEILTRSSLIVYFNHISLDDSVIVLYVLVKYLGEKIVDIYAPESRKHFDFSRSPINAVILRVASLLGLKLYPVVQHYDKNSYPKNEQINLLRKFFEDTVNALNEKGNVLVIAPEGTRSKDGKLQRAQKGIENIGRRCNNVYFLPIGLYPRVKMSRNYNFGRKYGVVVGDPFHNNGTYTADELMKTLADYLPENMRGLYSNTA